MKNRIRITLIAICLFAYVGMTCTKYAQAQKAQTEASKNLSPELIGKLTKELSITPEQAVGGAGAIFGLAQTKLKPAEFTKVADVVPDMDGLLKAAPKPKKGAAGMLSSMGGMLPGKAGGIASLAGSFKSLGLSTDTMVKFVPIMTQFVQTKGGSSVGNLLSGALK